MAIERFRISKQGREQLIRLKRFTGVETWNVLCRWAFCVSLAEEGVPPETRQKNDQAMEMDWQTFGGSAHEIYLGLLKQRCLKDGIELTDENLVEAFGLHLHRGLGYLSADKNLRQIEALCGYLPKKLS